MKDISVICGVSIATVSKALNDQNDISREMKEKVRKVAGDLGYLPNSAAQALKTNKSNNIGVLFIDEARSGLTHDYFAHVLDSFKRTAEENGYDITFINGSQKDNGSVSYLAHAQYRGFDGVVIACVDFYDPRVEQLVRGNIPVVTIDHVYDNRVAIISDNVNGMKDLLTYCYGQGHRRIAYIHGAYSSVTQSRLSSFYKTAEALHLDVPEEYILEADYRSTDKAYLCTQKLLELPVPPTCILYPDDFACFGGISAIQARGLRIPEDISIAGYDGIPIAQQFRPQLTTVMQDTERLGSLAAQKLIGLIDQPRTTLVEQLVVEGHVEPGGSVGKVQVD